MSTKNTKRPSKPKEGDLIGLVKEGVLEKKDGVTSWREHKIQLYSSQHLVIFSSKLKGGKPKIKKIVDIEGYNVKKTEDVSPSVIAAYRRAEGRCFALLPPSSKSKPIYLVAYDTAGMIEWMSAVRGVLGLPTPNTSFAPSDPPKKEVRLPMSPGNGELNNSRNSSSDSHNSGGSHHSGGSQTSSRSNNSNLSGTIINQYILEKRREEGETASASSGCSSTSTSSPITPAMDRTPNSLAYPGTKVKEAWEIDPAEVEIEQKIGEGGYGSVYKGKWRGTTVAIKKLLNTNLANEASFQKFEKEIRLMSSLRHPNIVMFLGASLNLTDPFYITEYVEQGNLHDVLARNTGLTWKEKINMARGAARGMLYLHKNNPPVIHRDLKSLNILIDENFNAKVCDFGVSKVLSNTTTNNTNQMGTLKWTAPELMTGAKSTKESDVYAFGMVLWELLTGEFPFEGKSIFEILRMVDHGERPPIPPNSDAAYVDLMKRCWAQSPEDRPTFEEILTAIEGIYQQSTQAERAPAAATVAVKKASSMHNVGARPQETNPPASTLSAPPQHVKQSEGSAIRQAPADAKQIVEVTFGAQTAKFHVTGGLTFAQLMPNVLKRFGQDIAEKNKFFFQDQDEIDFPEDEPILSMLNGCNKIRLLKSG